MQSVDLPTPEFLTAVHDLTIQYFCDHFHIDKSLYHTDNEFHSFISSTLNSDILYSFTFSQLKLKAIIYINFVQRLHTNSNTPDNLFDDDDFYVSSDDSD